MDRATGMTSVTAAEQLQKSHPSGDVQPLPEGLAGRAKASDVGIADAETITFIAIGDHGGVKAPGPQNAVSYAIQKAPAPDPAFVYSVGDIVYFYGEEGEYPHQFYEPYAHVKKPIVGIPGNHDGDKDPTKPAPAPSLAAFMANFCDKAPSIPACDPHFEFGRHTQTQPYSDWTLDLRAVTIIGLYSNVPSGGHLEESQIKWLTEELAQAAKDKPLIVALHHPPYSVDAHHGGSKHMGDALDEAFAASGRAPDMVLSGHVHDYQRFLRVYGEKKIAYVVIGNSGYHNLHLLAKDAEAGKEIESGVTFEYGDAHEYGFLRLTVSGGKISGEYTGVHPGTMPDGSDATVTPAKDAF
jgi:predicted MPP superfamily phosphohydrolase